MSPLNQPPRFATVISITGPSGNIFAVIAKVKRLARQLDLPQAEVDMFIHRIHATNSYDAALAVVNEWFRTEDESE